MARRTFGYQISSPLLVLTGEPERKDTTMRIPSELRAFLDNVILESRISDKFAQDPTFRSYAGKVIANARN